MIATAAVTEGRREEGRKTKGDGREMHLGIPLSKEKREGAMPFSSFLLSHSQATGEIWKGEKEERGRKIRSRKEKSDSVMDVTKS